MKVLIVKLSSIGDVIHTLPALSALKKGLGKNGEDVRIDWIVEEAASGILSGNPMIDDLIIVKNRGWVKNLRENIKIARLISAKRYDMVIDFQGLLKSGIWVFLSKGKRRIGYSNAREMSGVFLNEKIPPYDPERHAVDRYLDLAKHAGGQTDSPDFMVDASGISKERALKALERSGLQPEAPFFVLITRARWKTKLWSDDKFITLAKKMILQSGSLNAVLVGSPGDRMGLEAMRAGIGSRAFNLAGEVDLKDLAALLRLSRFVVTVDSGPMHIAAAAGARVVALFGPTAPWRTGPYGKGHIIIRKGMACSPCFRRDCNDARCMDEITVQDVIEGASGFLKS